MTHEEFENILQNGEGHKTEFKRTPSQLDRDIVGFANASGGDIFIGVSDDGEIEESPIDESLKSHIRQIADNCNPPVEINMEEWEGLLIVHVQEGWMKPHRFSSGFYLRNGATTQRLSREEISKILGIEGKLRFDEIMVPRFDFYTHFDKAKYDRIVRMGELQTGSDIDTTLSNLHVAERQNGELIFNNTGVLFFARNLADFYYHTGIDCVLYEGPERDQVIAKRSNNEDILSAIDGAMNFIKENIPVINDLPEQHEVGNEFGVPYSAIREALVNAVAHRNYFDKGMSTKIEIFNDSLEISSPGGLPAGLPSEEFGIATELRNPAIAELLQTIGYMECDGGGIRKIQQKVQGAGLPPVQFEYNGAFAVHMHLPVQRKTRPKTTPAAQEVKKPARKKVPPKEKLSISKFKSGQFKDGFGKEFDYTGEQLERKITLLEQIVRGDPIDYESIQESFDVSRKTIKRDLKALKEDNLIVFEGAPKTGKYVLTKEGKESLEKL